MWKCDRKIWRGMNGKLYEDGDPRAQVLVATPGDELPKQPVVEKALKQAENKALKPGSNKSGVQANAPTDDPFPNPDDSGDAEG